MADAGLAIVLHILTLNIWGLPDLGFQVLAPLRKERVEAICEELKRSSFKPDGWDVILLQEVWVKKDRETLKDCGYTHIGDAENKKVPLDSGLLILSRFPIEQVERLTYPPLNVVPSIPDGEAFAKKSALLVKIKHPTHGSFWVGNTHLVAQYNTQDIYFNTRRQQFQMYTQWALEKASHDPLILGGDWNFGMESPLWNLISENLVGFGEPEEAKNFCTVCPPNTMHKTSEGKLDHIFASPHFNVEEGNLAFTEPLMFPEFHLNVSDHFGWEITLTLENKH